MQNEEIKAGVLLVTEVCCACGIAFAMPKELKEQRRNDHKDFYCPAGHGQHYTDLSEAERLRNEVSSLRRRMEEERNRGDMLERKMRAAKGRATKLKNKLSQECGAHG